MLKNLLLFIIILITLYLLAVFNAPNLANNIENIIWIEGLWNKITNFKSTTDWVVTNIPSREEFNKAYDDFYSWALEFKDNIETWADITKDKINTIRETVWWSQETYEDIKEWIKDAKDFIDSASWVINQTKDIIEDVSEINTIITNTWIIN